MSNISKLLQNNLSIYYLNDVYLIFLSVFLVISNSWSHSTTMFSSSVLKGIGIRRYYLLSISNIPPSFTLPPSAPPRDKAGSYITEVCYSESLITVPSTFSTCLVHESQKWIVGRTQKNDLLAKGAARILYLLLSLLNIYYFLFSLSLLAVTNASYQLNYLPAYMPPACCLCSAYLLLLFLSFFLTLVLQLYVRLSFSPLFCCLPSYWPLFFPFLVFSDQKYF